jgi:putative two-component system response regulator
MATVLIADDNPAARRLLHLTLRAHHTLIEAEDGAEVLELAARHRPDIVILDVAMPVMGGLEVCRRLRADPALRDVGIIILSASSRPGQAREAGADRFLEKPCLPSRIRAVVDELLRGRHDTQADNDRGPHA